MESKLNDGEEKSGGVEDAGWRRERKIVDDEDSGKSSDGDGNSSEDEQKVRRAGGSALENEGSDAEVTRRLLEIVRSSCKAVFSCYELTLTSRPIACSQINRAQHNDPGFPFLTVDNQE